MALLWSTLLYWTVLHSTTVLLDSKNNSIPSTMAVYHSTLTLLDSPKLYPTVAWLSHTIPL